MARGYGTGLRLSLLWASVMFLYIYNDYFSLYIPGTVEDISAGKIGPFDQADDYVLIGLSLMLAAPALMIYFSTALPWRVSRWTNVVLGAVYTVIQALTLVGSEPFYQIVVVLEIGLTALIIWHALRWKGELRE